MSNLCLPPSEKLREGGVAAVASASTALTTDELMADEA